MNRMQRERLPKSKMASSDDRFTFEIAHMLRFENQSEKFSRIGACIRRNFTPW